MQAEAALSANTIVSYVFLAATQSEQPIWAKPVIAKNTIPATQLAFAVSINTN
jgi:hypothetical protein